MSVSEPGKIITPWAESGLKNHIPPAANPTTGRAGFDQGFSAINMTAKEAGGIPPFGQDFNGIFYEVTNILRYMQAGGQPTFDAALATAIGGYPKGAMVLGSDGVTLWQSQIESNSADPDIDSSNWGTFDIGLKAQLAAPGGSGLIGDFHSVTNKNFAGGAAPDGTTLNDAAFLAAEASAGASPIYVPAGVYRLSTPMIHGYTAKYYGPGVLKYDNAEWWRKGGSSGSISKPEKYTLFYDFDNQGDVSITFDNVAQPLTWIDARTVQAPGSLTTTAVRINILNGRLHLTETPESPRSFNLFAGSGGSKVAPSLPDPLTNPTGMNNASYGPRNLMDLTTGGNNTSGGSRSLLSLSTAENNTAFGFQALYRTNADGNTAVGSIAGEHLTTGSNNTLMGLAAGGGIVTGENNVAIGFEALNESDVTKLSVAVGYRAMANAGGADTSQCVAVGAFSQDFAGGLSNTSVGYRSLNGDGGGLVGADNTAQGAFAGRHLQDVVGTCVFGSMALMTETSADELFAMGFQSLMRSNGGIRNTGVGTYSLSTVETGSDNTAVGWSGQKLSTGSGNTSVGSRTQEIATTGSNNSTLGFEAGRNVTTGSANTLIGSRAGREVGINNDNVAIGSDSLQFLTTGSTNTALGRSTLRLMQDGTNATTISNCAGVGSNARVSGSNQVQIGDPATTTYVYGTVANRSDERDKADVEDTILGIDFIMGLRPVDGRWDMREDYLEEYQVQIGIDHDTEEPVFETRARQLPKDGSKKRVRKHHWFIAQEVKSLCDSMGVDFGGFQDHTIDGGCDVQTLGYDEFIPPTVKAVQQCWTRLDELEKRIAALE